MDIIDYRNVEVRQEEMFVLGDVTFTVQEGDFVYLIGKVGSGKSSLFKTLYCELDVLCPMPDSHAIVLGMNLMTMKKRQIPRLRRQMGIVFQDFQLLRDRTVHRNLDFVLRSTGWKKKDERDKRSVEVLEMVKLADKKDKFIYELSGGEQQRICIARAILNNPKVILADEPTGNLDAENGELILALLDEIRRQNHTAIILSTHNMQWPEYFPGTVYRCEDAKLVTDNKE